MRFTQPTPEQERLWQEWLNEPGREAIREVASRFNPWTLYRLKTTGQRVYILSFSDPGEDGKVRCRIGVSGEFNLITFERDVFGVDTGDLEECDLPGPDELLGTLELPIEEIKKLRTEYPDGAPPRVMNELIYRFPLQKRGRDEG